MANRFHPKGHKTPEQIKAIKAKQAEKNRPKVSFVTDTEEKKLLLGLNKKSNRELNDILNKPHLPPKFSTEIEKIFDKRLQEELIRKKIASKGFDTNRINISIVK